MGQMNHKIKKLRFHAFRMFAPGKTYLDSGEHSPEIKIFHGNECRKIESDFFIYKTDKKDSLTKDLDCSLAKIITGNK